MNNTLTPTWACRIPEWTKHFYALAVRHNPIADLRVRPRVHFNLRGVKGGVCDYSSNTISLNPLLTEEQAENTYAHELAHHFSYSVHQARGHGVMFRHWMRVLGHVPSRCHNYSNLIEAKRGDWYHCPPCGVEFKSTKDFTFRFHRCAANKFVPMGQRTYLKAGRAGAVPAPAMPKVVVTPVAPDRDTMTFIHTLTNELHRLKINGAASSPEAKKLRVQLRRLNPNWRNM